MKKTKLLTKFVIAILAATLCLSSVGCGASRNEAIRDDRTINVKVYKGGYGDSWIYSLADKFEEAYKEQGYHVNICTPSSDLNGTVAAQELYDRNSDWADVYICPLQNTRTLVYGADYADNGKNPLVADLTDLVWNQKPIGFDGKEEDVAIKNKIMEVCDDSRTCYDGKKYLLNRDITVGGMIVNTKKLATFGYNDLPKTSGEMFEMFDTIQSTGGNIRPLTYIGTSNGYHLHVSHCWFAQYTGEENYEKFWSYIDENGEPMISNGYEVYDDKGLDEMMLALYRMYDPEYAAKGSGTNTLSLMHSKVMNETGGAVFAPDGDWAYNELLVDYRDQIGDLAFMNIPVISALGTKLFGAGTSYNFSDEKCEEILRWTIGKVDEGKSENEIVSLAQSEKSWTLALKDVTEIEKARGIYCNRSGEGGNVCVAERSQNKDIAALFLRMMFSDDAAVDYNRYSNGYMAVKTDFSKYKQNNYSQAFNKIISNKYVYGVYQVPKGIRINVGPNSLLAKAGTFLVEDIIVDGVTAFDNEGNKIKSGFSAYEQAAAARMADERASIKRQWDQRVRDAGLTK